MFLYSNLLKEGKIEKIIYEMSLWKLNQKFYTYEKNWTYCSFFSWSIKTLSTLKLTYRTNKIHKQNTQTTHKTTKQKYGSSYAILFHRADYSQDSQSLERCQLDGISQISFSIWENHLS